MSLNESVGLSCRAPFSSEQYTTSWLKAYSRAAKMIEQKTTRISAKVTWSVTTDLWTKLNKTFGIGKVIHNFGLYYILLDWMGKLPWLTYPCKVKELGHSSMSRTESVLLLPKLKLDNRWSFSAPYKLPGEAKHYDTHFLEHTLQSQFIGTTSHLHVTLKKLVNEYSPSIL